MNDMNTFLEKVLIIRKEAILIVKYYLQWRNKKSNLPPP